MANRAHNRNERGPRLRQKPSDIWKAKSLTGPERVMLWLGWVPASIVRYIDCVWCGKEFVFSGEATADPPRYCTDTHRRAAKKAREKRLASPGIEPGVEALPAPPPKKQPRATISYRSAEAAVGVRSKCRCRGHTGKPKARYRTNAYAASGLMSRHLKYANGRIYQCPTSSYWHITTQMERKVAS